MFRKISIIIFLLCGLFVGCTNNQGNEQLCPSEPQDKLFVLASDEQVDQIRAGDEVHLIIRNVSKYSIWFPQDLNLLMSIQYEQDSYRIVKNLANNEIAGDIVLNPSGGPNDTFRFVILPDVARTDGQINVDILVLGHIYQEGKICERDYFSKLTLVISP
jgi:hypothetical protein